MFKCTMLISHHAIKVRENDKRIEARERGRHGEEN